MARFPITPKGLLKLQAELKRIRSVERPAIVRAIEEALAHGDLSENAEYHAAKDRQGQIEGQLRYVEGRIASAEVIDPATLSGDRVVFGATVVLVDLDNEAAPPVRYQIVGESEASIEEGTISFSSPVGRALIGKNEGDEALVVTPGGRRRMLIDEVSFG
mgnify:CR=1 FL=1